MSEISDEDMEFWINLARDIGKNITKSMHKKKRETNSTKRDDHHESNAVGSKRRRVSNWIEINRSVMMIPNEMREIATNDINGSANPKANVGDKYNNMIILDSEVLVLLAKSLAAAELVLYKNSDDGGDGSGDAADAENEVNNNNLIGYGSDESKENESPGSKKVHKQGVSDWNETAAAAAVPPPTPGPPSTFPPDIVFYAISWAFPRCGSAESLKEQYKMQTKELPPEEEREANSQLVPNIDAIEAISLPADLSLHTFKSLLCRRCFLYDCPFHRNLDVIALPPPEDIKNCERSPIKLADQPCGFKCYKLLIDPKNRTKTAKARMTASKSADGEETNNNNLISLFSQRGVPTWTGSDQSLFRCLWKVFPNNYCVIAKTMLTKTCVQVYKFALIDHNNIDKAPPSTESAEEEEKVSPGPSPGCASKNRHRQFTVHYTKLQKMRNKSGTVYQYRPCVHEGCCVPGKSQCRCLMFGNFCEKFCKCSKDCPNRFPGCRCKGVCNTKSCPCYRASRECDPDLCRQCGAHQFNPKDIRCKNVGIQRGFKKEMLLGESSVAGTGTFIANAVQKGELISEYVGEIITQDEANRRGIWYDEKKCSYLFEINNEFVIDADSKGNIMRFANHSLNPNCYAKVLMVNGDHRVGIYALQNLEAGEELFFNYNYSAQDRAKYLGVERKKL